MDGIKVIKLKSTEDIEEVVNMIEENLKPNPIHKLDKDDRDAFLKIINLVCDQFENVFPEYEPDYEDEVSLTAINSLYKYLPQLRGVLASVVSPLMICLTHDKPKIFTEFIRGVEVLSISLCEIMSEMLEKDIKEEEVI